MKYGTYISSAFHFGLIAHPDYMNPNIRYKISERTYNNRNSNIPKPTDFEANEQFSAKAIVPFEQVDGLTLEELKDHKGLLFENRYLVFVMYDSVTVRDVTTGYKTEYGEPKEKAIARYVCLIDTEKNGQYTIDELIEALLIKRLPDLNEQNRKRVLCFLEEYVCKGYGEVNTHLYNVSYKKGIRDSHNYTNFRQRKVWEDEEK